MVETSIPIEAKMSTYAPTNRMTSSGCERGAHIPTVQMDLGTPVEIIVHVSDIDRVQGADLQDAMLGGSRLP